MIKKISAYKIYLINAAATSLFFTIVFTLSSMYYIETVKLNPLQLVLVGTVLETACFIFEIPTGIVADIYSRRLSVIIGIFLIGSGFVLEGMIPLYIAVLASQVLWGVGATFISGAEDAWIADELGEENLHNVYLKATQLGQIFSLIGIGLSIIIGGIALNLPMVVGGVMFLILGIFLIMFMPENQFNPMPMEDLSSWQKMGNTFRIGIKSIVKKPLLIVITSISLMYGLYSEGFDRLWQAHFLKDMTFPTLSNMSSVVWFGIINGIAMVLSIVVVELIKRRLRNTGKLELVWLLTVINIMLVAGIISFGASGNFTMAFMTYCTSYIIRKSNGPVYRAWLNQNIESRVRATVLSTVQQMDAFGQILGGPVIGYIAHRFSVSMAIVIAGMILTPVIILYLYAGRITKQEEIKGQFVKN